MKPRKELGQHWLSDEASLQAVAGAAEVEDGDMVVEIGPGMGTLTKVLLDRGAHVVAVEFDTQLAQQLQDRFQGLTLETAETREAAASPDFARTVLAKSGLEVVNQDILQFDFSRLSGDFKVAGNIPYYLTSKLIRNLLELSNQPKEIGLLVQKEVAQRIVAQPGQMSVLAVAAQLYADCTLGLVVPAHLFTPPPKVDSQVVRLVPKQLPAGFNSKKLFRVVKAGFSERRKKLTNSLSGGLQIEKNYVQEVIKELGWSETIRAQELSVQDWQELSAKLSLTR